VQSSSRKSEAKIAVITENLAALILSKVKFVSVTALKRLKRYRRVSGILRISSFKKAFNRIYHNDSTVT
jgi:hypothetical protein